VLLKFFNFRRMTGIRKIGIGGGCHWCTEAIFQAVKGVQKVEQGYISSIGKEAGFSEAVVVYYDPKEVNLNQLLKIHLLTHHSTSNHSFRKKYRSAVYSFSSQGAQTIKEILAKLQQTFDKTIITKVLPLRAFRPSREAIQNYYKRNPDAPFCIRYIKPKLMNLKELQMI
jgi:peptide-methionine (S)-S-oxide reductase